MQDLQEKDTSRPVPSALTFPLWLLLRFAGYGEPHQYIEAAHDASKECVNVCTIHRQKSYVSGIEEIL